MLLILQIKSFININILLLSNLVKIIKWLKGSYISLNLNWDLYLKVNTYKVLALRLAS